MEALRLLAGGLAVALGEPSEPPHVIVTLLGEPGGQVIHVHVAGVPFSDCPKCGSQVLLGPVQKPEIVP
jgi:hypothetical protein